MILAFTGAMGVGKTTATDYIKKLDHNGLCVKFAQPLYDMQTFIYNRVGRELPRVKDRKLLQFLGTDWGRSTLGESVWVDLWEKNAHERLADDWLVLCDDCRFTNEAAKIKEMGGIVVHIKSEWGWKRIDTGDGFSNHQSEAGVNPNLVDYTLENNGTIEEFEEKLRLLYADLVRNLNQKKEL